MQQSKKAHKMSGIKRLHQGSETNTKVEYMFWHLFGATDILMESSQKLICLPLSMNLHDGVKTFYDWENTNEEIAENQASHAVQMVKQAAIVSAQFGKSIVLLGRYFSPAPALVQWKKVNQDMFEPMYIILKSKSNAVAYEYPPAKRKGRRAPSQKGQNNQTKGTIQ